MNKLVFQGRALIDGELRDHQMLICEAGRITYLGDPLPDLTPDVQVTTGTLVPGYIDIHVHGSAGHDVMDASEEALQGISANLARYGVTSFLATTLTGELEHLEQVVATCRRFTERPVQGAQLIGIHLEGPWINVRHKGAQNGNFVIPPTVADAQRLYEASGGLLKIVTLAPEQPESAPVIAYLHQQGVQASCGHSDATYEQVHTAMQHGLSHVTHCYNAMRGLHHREPGVVGAAMYHDELTTELIADGIHVHPVAMSILYRLKQSSRLALVSDGMRAVGMADGAYDLGGLAVELVQGEARLADGTLAGSTLTLEQAVKNMVTLCHVPLGEAVTMASTTPAHVVGVAEQKGRLAVGYDADILVLDDQLNVRQTYVGGRQVF